MHFHCNFTAHICSVLKNPMIMSPITNMAPKSNQLKSMKTPTQSSCLVVFIKDWSQSFLIKGSKIIHWTADHFSVFCFPWAKVWKNINFLVIYHTNLFHVKFLQKCHQLSNLWFELFFITLLIFNSCLFSFMGWNQANIFKKCQIWKSLKIIQ